MGFCAYHDEKGFCEKCTVMPKLHDAVNHPKHYTNSPAKCPGCGCGIECIDITRHMSFNVGNAIKYLWRYKDKNGVEDLKKALWYIQDQINLEE